MKNMFRKFIKWLFIDEINNIAEEKLKTIALEDYITQNLIIKSGVDLAFNGVELSKIMVASFCELLKREKVDNFVVMKFFSDGYDDIEIEIRYADKLSQSKKQENTINELNEQIARLNRELTEQILETSRIRVVDGNRN